MMPTEILVAVVGVLGAAAGYVVKALVERKSLTANAAAAEASATAVVIAAARELVDPLRKELALERQEHAAGVEAERQKLALVRAELAAAITDSQALRGELRELRKEMRETQEENATYRRHIGDLERELAAARGGN